MKCPKCQFENADNAVFCINCGVRLDGQVTCPNCRETIPSESKFCPKCGAKIPHTIEDDVTPEKTKSFSETKAKMDPIFQIAFTACSVAIIIIAMICCFFSIVEYSGTDTYLLTKPGTAVFYIWGQWGALAEKVSSNSSYANGAAILSSIVTFIFASGCVIVTFMFGIKGLIEGIKQLTKGKKCRWTIQKSLISILCVYIGTYAVIVSFSPQYGTTFVEGSAFSTVIGLSCTLFFVAMVYSCFRSFDKQHISMFVQKVVFSLCFFFAIGLIESVGKSFYYYVDSTVYDTQGINAFYTYLISQMGSYVDSQFGANYYWATFVLSTASVTIFVSIAIMATSLLGYFLYGFLSPSETSLGFKLPFYVVSTVLMILSTIYLVFSIVTVISFASLMQNSANIFYLPGTSALTAFTCSLFIFGCSMASFFICRKNVHNERLINRNQL